MQVFQRLCALGAILLCANAAYAESHRLQDNFTFRRVSVGSTTPGKRITVQVTPQVAVAPVATETTASAPVPKPAAHAWFWNAVSPDIADSRPGRLHDALLALRDAPSGDAIPVPRLSALQGIASAHGMDILRETVGTDVSPALVLALISVESAGRTDAQSHAGASGLMQLMPATAARFGVTDTLTPADNIKGGVAYLAWLMNHFDNDPILALAGYNAGEGAVRDNGGVPPYNETRNYVPRVLAAWTVARGLCRTPPELVTDGCVFSVSSS